MPNQTEIVNAPYYFSKDELVELSRRLAAAESRKKEVQRKELKMKASIKSEKEEIEEEIENLAQKVTSGQENRAYECVVVHDFEEKVKRYVREEDEAVLDTRPLTTEDWQMKMELDAEVREKELEELMSNEEDGEEIEEKDEEYSDVA